MELVIRLGVYKVMLCGTLPYKEAVRKYYDILGDKFYGELHNELIYLKRLAKIPLVGRDLI